MNNDNANQEVTAPQTPEAPAAEEPQGAAQATSEAQPSAPADQTPGSTEPTIPYSRFAEVNRKMREYEAQLAQAKQAQAPQQAPTAGAPKQDDFATYEEFIEARATHAATQAAEARYNALRQQEAQQNQARQQQERANSAYQNWVGKVADLSTKDPIRYQRAVETLGNMPAELGVMVMQDQAARELTEHFADHPEEGFRLASLPPIQAAMELGRLGAKLAGSKAPPASVSKAPRPIDPVGSGKTNVSTGFRNDMSQEEFNRSFNPIW